MSILLLVDGSALLHRAYHAYPPLRTKQGVIVGAVYGVISMLVSALDEQEPDEVVVAWDLPKPTFRHELYIAYKAQRAKADVEMVEQIPIVKEAIESMGLLQLEQEGYEADDIIGSIAVQATNNKFQILNSKSQINSNNQIINFKNDTEVVILTGDQDLMQLVTDKVRLLMPARGKYPAKLYGPDEVVEKYGVTTTQFVDYKALMGDPSDNIPGVRGIGPKGASKLLSEYGSLEGIYDNLSKIEGRLSAKLEESKESAYLSQKLARIECGMELEIDQEQMEYDDLRGRTLQVKLEELNFQSLIRRLFPKEEKRENTNQMGLF